MPVTGNQSTYSPEKATTIIELLGDGIPLREICRMDGMPAWRTVYDWMVKDDSLSAAIARARELGQDAIAEDTLQIVDSEPERGPDGKIDSAWVQLQKVRVEQRLKLLAKWNPKRYGDRVTTEHTGTLGFTDLSNEELARRLAELEQARANSER